MAGERAKHVGGRGLFLAGWAALLVSAWLTLTGGISVQDPARTEVALQALAHVRESLPPGRVVLDPRLLCQARLTGWACPDRVSSAVQSLRMDLGSREFNYVCLDGRRSSCQLVGADVLLELLEPRIRGGSATIQVNIWWRTGDAERPVGQRRSVLHLVRRSGNWRVQREEIEVPREMADSEGVADDEPGSRRGQSGGDL